MPTSTLESGISTTMACRRGVLILIPLFTLIYGEVKVIEINVSKYEGLKSSQLNNREKQKQFYDFQFCMCPRAVQLHSQPWATSKCECKPTIKGKRVIDSTPHAIFPMSCASKVNSHNCLKASFKKTNNERVFVKVSIGSRISVTLPLWQELPLDRMRNSRSLTTSTGTPFKINYDVLTSPSFSSKESQVMNVWKPKSMKSSLFNLLFKKKIEALGFKTTSMEKTQRHRVAKAIESAPRTKDDITSVARYTTIEQIRGALFRQSLKDKITPSSFDVRVFKEELTTYHNIFRSRHDAPPLQYDYTLEKAAQNWANSLGSRRSCLVHEVPRRYGENLFYFGAKKFPSAHVMAQLITQSFYMEGVGYNYNRFPTSYYKTGHFTQLIWKGSRKMGVGVSIVYHNGSKKLPCQPGVPLYMIYVVVKYDPPGNFLSYESYMNNVKAPKY